MNSKTKSSRVVCVAAARTLDPPIPHPSWRMALAGADRDRPDRIINAEDFWRRLGI